MPIVHERAVRQVLIELEQLTFAQVTRVVRTDDRHYYGFAIELGNSLTVKPTHPKTIWFKMAAAHMQRPLFLGPVTFNCASSEFLPRTGNIITGRLAKVSVVLLLVVRHYD